MSSRFICVKLQKSFFSFVLDFAWKNLLFRQQGYYICAKSLYLQNS